MGNDEREILATLRLDVEQALGRAAIKQARLTVLLGNSPSQDEEWLAMRIAAYYQTYLKALQKASEQ